MAVDKYYRCYINTGFVTDLVKQAQEVSAKTPCETCGATSHVDLAYVAGLIFHESQHPLREHIEEAAKYGAPTDALWNIAADAEINDDALEIFGYEGNKVCLPGGELAGWTPEKLREDFDSKASGCSPFKDNDLWESYYVQLKNIRSQLRDNQSKKEQQEQQEQQGGQPQQGQGQSQQQEEGEEGQGQGQEQDEGGSEGKSQGQGGGQSQGQSGQQQGQGGGSTSSDPGEEQQEGDQVGDGEGGNLRPWLTGDNQDQDCTDGQPWEQGPPTAENPGVNEGENKAIQREVAKKIREAQATRGNVPGGMLIWADDVLSPPKVDWRKLLRQYVRKAINRAWGHKKRSWHSLGRASASTGYKALFPHHFTPRPNVGVVFDTSGSMGSGPGSPLYEGLVGVQGICKKLQATVHFCSVDSAAGEIQAVTDIKRAKLTGGGGTDMRVGVEAFEKAKLPLDVVVVLTDGYTPWPDHSPKKFTLVAAIVGSGREQTPDWLKTVYVELEDKK